ncbi:MAG: hypothetical protein HYX73_07345 [Acidobacteria bacterium]|nr:hypothetical protein [Acidobacteriota bacterium]
MTAQMKKRLRIMNRNIKKNAPRISKKLAKIGVHVDEPIIVSSAKYYDALKKLAKE